MDYRELPEEFLEKMKQFLGEEYPEYLASYEEEPRSGLRVNTGRLTPEQFLEMAQTADWNLKPVPWTKNGFYYQGERPSRHPWYYAGLYYLQEPSAMAPAAWLPIKPGDRVLDLCAAPGGKSTELAAKLAGTGVLFSNDISNSRAKALLKNLEMFGAGNICVTSEAPEKMAGILPEFFDKILVDAPCSGEGMFRREKNAAVEYNSDSPEYCARRQSEILESAAEMLRYGGRLVYSTCTFSVAENEGVVSAFLKRHSDFHLIQTPYSNPYFNNDTSSGNAAVPFDCAADFSVCGEMAKTVRLMPHRVQGEGHFAAVFEKDGQDDVKREFDGANSPEGELFLQFSQRYLNQKWTGIKVFGGNVYLFPHKLEQLKRCNVIGKGLFAGQNLKGRFVPSHALCMALTPGQVKQVIELDGIQLTQYLRGETLQMASSDGWGTICYKGVNVGWYKAVDGMLKNHFPKGLRI